MAAIAEGTITTPAGMNDVRVEVLSRVRAALQSAGNYAWVSAGAVLFADRAQIIAAIGNGSDRPDFTTLKGIGVAATTAGAAAGIGFLFRYFNPKATVATK